MTGPAELPHAPATRRNREPILEVLRRHLPDSGTVVEIASGTGEHAAFFAARLPHLTWLPSDADEAMLAVIRMRVAEADMANLAAPLVIDAAADDWNLPVGLSVAAIANINMIHIAPLAACEGLLAGAGRYLAPDGVLYLYGPYKVAGRHTAPSNKAFDRGLRTRNPEWGVRDLDDVTALAGACGLDHADTVAMPANNLSVIFRRRRESA